LALADSIPDERVESLHLRFLGFFLHLNLSLCQLGDWSVVSAETLWHSAAAEVGAALLIEGLLLSASDCVDVDSVGRETDPERLDLVEFLLLLIKLVLIADDLDTGIDKVSAWVDLERGWIFLSHLAYVVVLRSSHAKKSIVRLDAERHSCHWLLSGLFAYG
jgi:hypothetical protein